MHPHQLVLPEQFSLGDTSFLPTMEAVTESPVTDGNKLELLLNGDQFHPAQLRAIRAATKTITYAQYYYEDGRISRDIAAALSERCAQGVRGHILLDAFGTLMMPGEQIARLDGPARRQRPDAHRHRRHALDRHHDLRGEQPAGHDTIA